MTDSESELGTQVGHCKADSTDVYIGRGRGGANINTVGVPTRGWLGNPYALDDGWSREESIEQFREDFEEKIRTDETFRDAVALLSGDTLGCWCQHVDDDGPACHGEVIAEWADRLAERKGIA
jgi:hypothetical protein